MLELLLLLSFGGREGKVLSILFYFFNLLYNYVFLFHEFLEQSGSMKCSFNVKYLFG